MITRYVTFQLPGSAPRNMGSFTGLSERSIVFQVLERWPLLPPTCLYLDGQPIQPPKAPGFRDPGTRAKAAERLRDPEVQRRKVAARLATEAARRAREAAMTPEERAKLAKQRKARYDARWHRYWKAKDEARQAAKRGKAS
jgi:hypothetical protein